MDYKTIKIGLLENYIIIFQHKLAVIDTIK